MTLQAIKYGAAANDGTGDSLRDAMRKAQGNFEYLDQSKADAAATTQALGQKADAQAVNQALAGKADAAATTQALGQKADAQAVNQALAGKADAAATAQALATKVNAEAGRSLMTDDERQKLVGIASGASNDRSKHMGTQAIDTVAGLQGALEVAFRVRILNAVSVKDFLQQMSDLGSGYYRCDSAVSGLQQYSAGLFTLVADTFTFVSADYTTGRPLVLSGSAFNLAQGNFATLRPTERSSHTGTQDISTITGIVGSSGVVDSGSNANGAWTRFADGTQICRSSRRQPDGAWWFPATFAGGRPILSTGVIASTTEFSVRFSDVSVDRAVFSVRYWNGTTWLDGAGEYMDMIAIGRWKP